MSADCFQSNPLVHGGSSQDLRMVPALQPSTAPLDGRGTGQMILFMEKYGTLLNYYDSSNTINGHWQPFISHDLSTILASISSSDYNDCLGTFYKYYEAIQVSNTVADLKKYLKVLVDISFSLINEIRIWNEKLVLKTPAKEMFYGEISNHLSLDLRTLLLYYQASQPNFIDIGFTLQPGQEDYLPKNSEDILQENFKQEWWAKYNPADIILSWDQYKNVYLPPNLADIHIFGDPAWNDVDNIRYSSSFFRNVFTSIYNAYTRIINATRNYFEESITKYPWHPAHNGLILSFLHILGYTRQELNKLTDRHLNFYYKDVLRILRRPFVPDAAHIVFTLAKNIPPFTLPKGSEIIGGKDKLKKELIYATSDTITINNAEIGELKSVFLDEDVVNGGVYAAAVSNSLDGNGKELDPENPSWFAFGTTQSNLPEEKRSMTEWAPGFIISSPLFQLSEGEREITIEIQINNWGGGSFVSNELAGKFDIRLTGKKGWIELPNITSDNILQPNAIKVDTASNKIIIKFTLEDAVDPVVDLDAATHESTYKTKWPAIQFQLKKNVDVAIYKKFSSVAIGTVHLQARVSNAFTCILHNDTGGVDPKNPFMPFGARPKKNSNLFFGSREVFSKAVNSLTLHLHWLGLPPGTSFYDHYAFRKPVPGKSKNNNDGEVNYIDIPDSSVNSFTITGKRKDGDEFPCDPTPARLFASNNNSLINPDQQLVFSNLFTEPDPSIEGFETYDPSIRRGFLRITLTGPPKAFGHDVFSKIFTEQVIAVNKDSAVNSLPNEPYTPLLQSLTYDYVASTSFNTGSSNDPELGQFFQFFPFGHREMIHNSPVHLFQPFQHLDKTGVAHPLLGAFYIGIKNILLNQVLTIYFEFSEGSEDASLDPPPVNLSYLSANQWLTLENHILSDSTNNFLGSGILKFTVPEEMTDDNTAMAAGLRWIRIGITANHLAYPRVFAVFTNAVKAIFDNRDNDLSHLASPVKEGTIVKLLNSESSIKKLEQPFPSFDGRTEELDQVYYTRVSERLRHKHRAITIWDYERIILEQFSYLYKAKCLNHTNDLTEMAPGCVRIILVPDMSTKSMGNLFEPRISNNKRKIIRDYIRRLNCPFADLQVQNPQYEAIRVKCEVRFMEGLDIIAHLELLKADIDKFLAPWAFDESHGIDFGGSIHRSQIIFYIEKLPYLDYVTDFVMDLYINGAIIQTNVDEVKATTSKSILTSYRQHMIGTNVCAT